MRFAMLPPEVNSGLMYAGSGAGPLLAAASAWDSLAAELHAAAAGYTSVIDGLISEGWIGPASASMAAAATPYATWMSATAAQAEQTAGQARATVAAFEAAFAATVPPALIAANRAQLAMLVATNILGQNTPAIAANEAQYAEMWAQDVSAMEGYDAAAKGSSALTPFTQPKQTTNPNGALAQLGANAQSAGNAVSSNAQAVASPAAATTSTTSTDIGSVLHDLINSPTVGDARTSLSWATFVPQNGSYMFSMINAMQSLMRALMPAAASGAAAAAANAAGTAGATGLGGFGSVLAGLGQAGTIGALSVPHAWAAASPLAAAASSGLGPTLASASSAGAANPGLLHGLPMLANAIRGAADSHHGAMPRFDLRPSVIPRSPAAG